MSKLKLEPCPFCGGKMHDRWPDVSKISVHRWNVCHYCPHPPHDELGVSINVYGSTKKGAVDCWNTRARLTNGQTQG